MINIYFIHYPCIGKKNKIIDRLHEKFCKSLSTNLSFSSFSQGGLGVGCHPCFCKGFHCRLEIHRTGAKELSPGMFTLTTRKLRPTLTLQQSGSISNHDALLTENRIMNSNTKRMFRGKIVQEIWFFSCLKILKYNQHTMYKEFARLDKYFWSTRKIIHCLKKK